MDPLLLPLPGNEQLARMLADVLGGTLAIPELRRFPDGETYIRITSPLADRHVLVLCTLARPDSKFLPLRFTAATARDLGAREIGLIAPYLAYMRQDRRFHEGEGLTSAYFAEALEGGFDWLVTIDPHLHRRTSLAEIYTIPALALHAAPRISAWIRENVSAPLIIGPDCESEQWVRHVAQDAGAPWLVLEKTRRGDRDVTVRVPEIDRWRDHTPVLVDDIISTARTMTETVGHLAAAGMAPPVCIGVHAVFAGDAYAALQAAGVARIVTCNTIPHPTNAIDLTDLLAEGVRTISPSSRR